MSRFLPTESVDSIFDIDVQKLKDMGKKGFLFDIDNTLATYDMAVPDDKTKKWIKDLQDIGFGIYLISNNNEKRVKPFAESINAGYIAKALKPRTKPIRQVCEKMGISVDEAVLVGDQLFTDIWGGSRIGMYTILVKPISSEVEHWFVRFKRIFERMIMRRMNKKQRG